MSVSHRVTGTWAELTADGSVAIPATPQAGDRMYLFARWKDFSITATVANWTELEEFTDGAVSSGNGVGSVKVACWYRDWQSGDANPTIDFSVSPTTASVVIKVMAKDADDVWLTPVARTAALGWTTSSQTTSASATVDVPSSSVVMGLVGLRDDSATMTRPTNGIDDSTSAITWNGNYVESPATHHSTATGDDGAADLGYRLVTIGATGVTLRMTGTISATETGAALWVVQGVSVQVTPGNASLTSSQFAPQLQLSVTPATLNLTDTQFAPQLRLAITPATASLSVTGFVPILQLQLTPAALALTLTTFNSQLREVTTPASVLLSITGFAPTLNTQLTPASLSLSLSGFAPLVSQLLLLTVPNASLILTPGQPHILPYRPAFIDPGGDSVQAIGHFNTEPAGSTGDVTFDNTQWVVGVGSYKFDSGAGADPAYVFAKGVLGAAGRVSTYFWYDSLPDRTDTRTQFVLTNNAYSGGGFSDAVNFQADDDTYATATPAQNSGQGTVFSSFGLIVGNLGPDVQIVSVKIIYERKYDVDTSIGVSRVKWRVNGEEGPNHDNTDMPLTDTVVEVDVTDDQFWEPQHLTDTAFEVIVEARRGDSAIEHTQSWDYVKVVVEYRPMATIMAAYENLDLVFSLALLPKGDYAVVRFVEGSGPGPEFTKFTYDGITKLFPDMKNRISFGYVSNGADDLGIKIYVNGIEELSIEGSATNGWDGSGILDLYYGWIHTPGVGHVCWFDQWWGDEGDDLADTGNKLSTHKGPATVNENEWNTTGGTGAVNERPLSETNYRQETRATQFRQNYTLQADDEGDVDLSGKTLVAHMGWAWAKKGAGSLDGIQLTVNGVDFESGSAATLITTTPSLIRTAIASPSYPSNAAGIGMASNNETADTFIYELGVVQAYEGPLNSDILLSQRKLRDEVLDTIIDDLRTDPPDSYEVCCIFPEFDGTVEIVIHSLTHDGTEFQYQGTLSGNGRLRITPGVEVRLDVTVIGVTMLQIWRRLNVD